MYFKSYAWPRLEGLIPTVMVKIFTGIRKATMAPGSKQARWPVLSGSGSFRLDTHKLSSGLKKWAHSTSSQLSRLGSNLFGDQGQDDDGSFFEAPQKIEFSKTTENFFAQEQVFQKITFNEVSIIST